MAANGIPSRIVQGRLTFVSTKSDVRAASMLPVAALPATSCTQNGVAYLNKTANEERQSEVSESLERRGPPFHRTKCPVVHFVLRVYDRPFAVHSRHNWCDVRNEAPVDV